jgi:TAG lipase / steryl ester hydrolase / phospholipase A2 / LPA acyltransferase
VFKPQQLLVKNMHGDIKPIGVHHSDGSLENDLPSDQLSELFNINHFIVSQVSVAISHNAVITIF